MMSFAASKTIESPSVGREIRNARTERGMSLEELSEKTRIPAAYLRAIEKGDLAALPPPVYTRGFLRRIASVLRGDAAMLSSLYERDRRLTEHVNGGSPHHDRPLGGLGRGSPFIITPRIAAAAAAVLVLVVVIGYVGVQVANLVAPPALSVEQPVGNDVVSFRTVIVSGRVELGSRLSINGADVHIGEDGAFSLEIPLEEGMNVLRVRAENRFGKVSEVVRQVVVPVGAKPLGE